MQLTNFPLLKSELRIIMKSATTNTFSSQSKLNGARGIKEIGFVLVYDFMSVHNLNIDEMKKNIICFNRLFNELSCTTSYYINNFKVYVLKVRIATPHLFVKPCKKYILEPDSLFQVFTTVVLELVSWKKIK